MSGPDRFPASLAEAQARIAAVRPDEYARSRNALDGAVTGLSPYITHGFVDLRQVAQGVAANDSLKSRGGFLFELGWREFFRHVWQHQGQAIFRSMHAGPLPDDAYSQELPVDVREARTGVPVIDQSVRTLYATGYLHNHARMWLASYVVHVRRVFWRAGADWLYAHLLDGDLASNHLSWQWVAGTFSSKPYLFNADNVKRYAPAQWHSPGSPIDASYEALERIARGGALPCLLSSCEGVHEPELYGIPPPAMSPGRPQAMGALPASEAAVYGRDVWLVHPWALRDPPHDLPADTVRVAIFTKQFHAKWAWSALRWEFVGARISELSAFCWYDSVAAIGTALRGARSVRGVDDPHIDAALRALADMQPPRQLFGEVKRPCLSFSQWWKQANVPF